ncbi:hypothetical protein ACYSNX_10405 [Myroides sp. LJL115]
MKNIIFLLSLCSIGLILACSNLTSMDTKEELTTNLDGSITIQGRVLVKETNQPPSGITSVNIANRWKFEIKDRRVKGENEKVFVDNNGYYRITIQKGDTIQLIPNNLIYKQITPNNKITGIEKNSTINFTLQTDSMPYLNGIKNYPHTKARIDRFLNETNPEEILTVSGIVKDKETGKLVKGLAIYVRFQHNTRYINTHHLTDEYGQYTLNVPYNSNLSFEAANYPKRTQELTVFKDTVANILF